MNISVVKGLALLSTQGCQLMETLIKSDAQLGIRLVPKPFRLSCVILILTSVELQYVLKYICILGKKHSSS